MALRLQAVTFEAFDAAVVAAFWAKLLDREVRTEPGGAFVPGDGAQIGLRFVTAAIENIGPQRLHLHLTSNGLEQQMRTVEKVLHLGGRHLDVGQRTDESHVVMADPDGNELCVIEPGNNYLADTGYLGEVTCAGTRDVGLFWRDALGWPLVWDAGAQTAIQSPLGGTKISWDSWDSPPIQARARRSRQRFDLAASDPTGETARLVALGAARLANSNELADPDGNPFELRPD